MENKMGNNVSKIEYSNTESGNAKKKYDADFKRQVVEIWQSGAYETVADCARSYNLNKNTLSTWLHNADKDPAIAETNTEMVKLKKELAKTKMELEILKKAAIYFANHAK
jgi:transposase